MPEEFRGLDTMERRVRDVKLEGEGGLEGVKKIIAEELEREGEVIGRNVREREGEGAGGDDDDDDGE